jgi:hypothetical protein
MKRKTIFFWMLPASVLLAPAAALATQGHGDAIHSHQMAHLFSLFSMGTLIYWLRGHGLVREDGWRYIQYAAFFFGLWNIDAFFAHLLDEQIRIIRVDRINLWQIRLESTPGFETFRLLYYFAKLDHLYCVPALAFLWAGLRRLAKESIS